MESIRVRERVFVCVFVVVALVIVYVSRHFLFKSATPAVLCLAELRWGVTIGIYARDCARLECCKFTRRAKAFEPSCAV